MDFVTVELLILLLFMIAGSLVAVEVRDLLSSIICLGAVGFGLALVDLFLGAPDLAIVQVVVEIVALVIMLRVVLTREDKTHETPKDTLTVGATAVVLGGLVAAAIFVMASMVPFGAPLFASQETPSVAYLKEGLASTGASNFVTAIILDFRGYDTLGEATVIFVSIIGAYAVLRKVGRLRPGQTEEGGAHE